jgi:mono/diheme cytochrome c family protein
MLRKLVIAATVLAAVGFGLFWAITMPVKVAAGALPSHTPDLANGKTMFYAGGCPACHAVPGQEDRTRLGGGLALKSPFGTFYAPNISPDPDDGIGRWSEADFVSALWKGTSPEGRHYFPAFPYTSYQKLALADVRDMFAFLKTLPPVKGRVRNHDVPFPFNVRLLLGGWKFLFLDGQPFTSTPAHSAQQNRGAYLVNAASHCAECHSPRNVLGGIVAAQRFAGGPDVEGEGWVPNITPKGRLADYSDKDLAYLLKTGDTPEGDSVGGSMRAVILNTGQLSDGDRDAMAAYLKSLPPVEGPTRPARKPE